MRIPMVDLKEQYLALKAEIDQVVQSVLDSTCFVFGPNLEAFEREVATYCGSRHAIGVASGTDALHLALRAAGIGPGDEVITTPFTFIGTAEAIVHAGATPVFVDIDPRSFNIDPTLIESAITERTRAMLPVHLFGRPADLAPIVALCRRHRLKLIEDCAQAFGARYRGRVCGTIGDAGCFSFFPSKNLGAYGDGGMVVTDDDTVAERLRLYRNHGVQVQYRHTSIGFNSRLDEVQAAVLRVKLKHVERFNRLRRRHAASYTERLVGAGVLVPQEDPTALHVFHQYTIRSSQRDAVRAALATAHIASAIYYPAPLHRQEAFAGLYDDRRLPVAEAAASQVLSLPMYPELREDQIEQICRVITRAIELAQRMAGATSSPAL